MTKQSEPKEDLDRGRRTSLVVAVLLAVAVVAGGVYTWSSSDSDPDESASASDSSGAEEVPSFESEVERGRWVYESRGCGVCHGAEGAGGVENANYVLGTVPALDEMADRLMLFGPEDAHAAIEMMEAGVDPETRRDEPPFEGYARFLAQYGVVLGVINNGATAAKDNPSGQEPPLQMPPWENVLTEEEKRAVVAYLVSLYDWEDEETGSDPAHEEGADPYADDENETDPYADDQDDPYADDEDDPYADYE